MSAPGRVITRDRLMARLENPEDGGSENALEQIVSRMRRKIAGSGVQIVTMRGVGYMARIRGRTDNRSARLVDAPALSGTGDARQGSDAAGNLHRRLRAARLGPGIRPTALGLSPIAWGFLSDESHKPSRFDVPLDCSG
ncbi:helix-turn-helix domain-containing protein [Paracoccus bogoriensis]|uniref:helix-turn-helix domain-containing protein n=1 Tax=Paracoccus bogoriensis TaxID=242065 RepID=UPI0031BBAACD